MSYFTSFELLPEDPILNLGILFAADKREQKVNLGIGSYKDETGQPVVLECVRKAEKLLLDKHLNKEYLPIVGNNAFISKIMKLVYGELVDNQLKGRLVAVQSVGGTGALRIGTELIARNRHTKAYFSTPTWINHNAIFKYGGMPYGFYPYYNKETKGIDFSAMCQAIKKMNAGDVVLLHACCHNPTGVDLSQEQWKELSELIKTQKLLPFFDLAYQGFGNGLEEDAFAVRYFAEQGHEMLVATSCSKNFGLYGERLGALSIITKDSTLVPQLTSQIKQVIRGCYSMPPLQGSRIVATILESEELTRQWHVELTHMRDRVNAIRLLLVEKLLNHGVKTDVSFFANRRGLFSYTGISVDQVNHLQQEYAIYMSGDGRINVAGLNLTNIDYFAAAIAPLLK